jgi:hypothetical protein
MMSEIEERREYLTDNEYLTMMNNCMQSYLNYRNERCTCTEDSFECYRYPRLLQNCRYKDTILQQAPLLSTLIPGHQIPADFKLQLEVKYEPYDNDLLVKTLRYLFNVSTETDYVIDKITCAFSVFHLIFKHHGLLLKSKKFREVAYQKINEFATSEESRFILENHDFSYLGITSNPIPIWWGELRSPLTPPPDSELSYQITPTPDSELSYQITPTPDSELSYQITPTPDSELSYQITPPPDFN